MTKPLTLQDMISELDIEWQYTLPPGVRPENFVLWNPEHCVTCRDMGLATINSLAERFGKRFPSPN